MHFRLGDYKDLQGFHPIMSIEYYKKSLSYILDHINESDNKVNVLYFCEAEDNDYVKQLTDELSTFFPHCLFHKVSDDMKDYEQMLLMSLCNHHIIANSSFSWFGAYFNDKPDKIVCHPDQWFCGQGSSLNTTDMCPIEWVCIQ